MDKEFDDNETDTEIANDPLDSRAQVVEKKEEKPDRKLSIREALQEAIKDNSDESDEKPVKPQAKKPEEKKNAKEDRKEVVKESRKEDDEEDGEEKDLKEVKPQAKKAEEKDSEEEVKEKAPAQKTKAPVSWSREAKETWDNLPETVRSAINKRETEVSNGFKEYGEKARSLERYDGIIQRYAPDYQNYGVQHPAELVERAFQWVQALRNPNRAIAVNSFKQLAQSHGIEDELRKIYGGSNNSNDRTDDDIDGENTRVVYQTDPQVAQELNELKRQFGQQQSTYQAEQQRNAQQFVAAWSADKPHFERVRQSMTALLQSNVIPLKNGQLDLDEAYARAVRMDPELYEEIVSEKLEAERKAREEKAAKAAAKKQADIERARKASVSLKPTAPTSNANGKDRGNDRKLTVRDSIRKAMSEVRN